jgi:hypothetical protein
MASVPLVTNEYAGSDLLVFAGFNRRIDGFFFEVDREKISLLFQNMIIPAGC